MCKTLLLFAVELAVIIPFALAQIQIYVLNPPDFILRYGDPFQ